MNTEKLTELAETLGRDHGKNAGAWVFDGNTSTGVMRRVLRMAEDGDPLLDEYQPSLPDLLPGDLVRALKEAEADEETEREIGEVYEFAFRQAAEDEFLGYAERMTSE